MSKLAIVTGANRGIGFEIVKGICKSDFKGVVYLTGMIYYKINIFKSF